MPYEEMISEKTLIEDLLRVSRKLEKKYIPIREYDIHGRYSHSTIKRRFGSWNRAMIIAGLKIYEGKNIPEKLLLINMENVWIKLGRLPVKRDMIKPLSAISESAYSNHYGSWSKALSAFSEFTSDREKYLKIMADNETKALSGILPSKTRIKKKRQSRAISYKLRYKVLNRDRFTCQACGCSPSDDKRVKLEIDHIIPWSKGGDTIISNLQTLCKECNLGKGTYSNKEQL